MTWSSLKLSLRIAYRDARSTKFRSFLVVMLLGLPVMAITIGAGLIDSFSANPVQRANYEMGQADAIVSWKFDGPTIQHPLYGHGSPIPAHEPELERVEKTREDILDALDQDSHLLETTVSTSNVNTSEGTYPLDLKGIDLNDRITTGMLEIVEGSAPGADEIALSADAATRLHTDIGETVRLLDRDHPVTVTGIVEDPQKTDDIFGVGLPQTVGGHHDKWLVDSPGPIKWEEVREYNKLGMSVYSKHVAHDPPAAPEPFQSHDSNTVGGIARLVLITTAVIVNVVLLASPAFAISAKHRAREYGLLAANGATPAQIRHIVLAGGVILAAVAAMIGISIGVAGVYLSTPLAEMFLAKRAWSFGLMPLVTALTAVATIMVGVASALLPALKTSRKATLVALNRSEETIKSPKRWALTGTIVAAAGVGTSITATNSNHFGLFILGLIAAQLGVTLWMPALVGLIAKLGVFVTPALRISLRYTSRNRGSAGPALAGITAVIATSVAFSMLMVAEHDRFQARQPQLVPHGTFMANVTTPPSEEAAPDISTLTEAATDIATIAQEELPLGDTYVLNDLACVEGEVTRRCSAEAVAPENKRCPYKADLHTVLTDSQQAKAVQHPQCSQREEEHRPWTESMIVDDKGALATFTGMGGTELQKAHDVLNDGGAIVSDSKMVVDGTATIRSVDYSDTNGTVMASKKVPALVHDDLAHGQVILGTHAAEAVDLTRSKESLEAIGTLERAPQAAEEDAFRAALRAAGYNDITLPEPSKGNASNTSVHWSVVQPEKMPRFTVALLLMFVIISAVVALLATAVVTALTAAQSRSDLRTLAAIGASPSIRRKLSMCQAGVMSVMGTVLGIASGTGIYYLLTRALNASVSMQYPLVHPYQTNPPWILLGATLVLLPGIAMAGGALLTRSRLPSEQRRIT